MGMRRTLRLAILAALATMSSACGRNANPAPNATEAPATPENVIDRIEALSDGQRNGVFIRAIRDAGLECQHVDWSTRSGTYEGMPVWTAACSRNQVWIIVVRADGTAQVLNPAEGLALYNRMDGNRL